MRANDSYITQKSIHDRHQTVLKQSYTQKKNGNCKIERNSLPIQHGVKCYNMDKKATNINNKDVTKHRYDVKGNQVTRYGKEVSILFSFLNGNR